MFANRYKILRVAQDDTKNPLFMYMSEVLVTKR